MGKPPVGTHDSEDNGGPGTYSQLLIMKDYMNRMAFDLNLDPEGLCPADYFDLMGGVGFGGYVSIKSMYIIELTCCAQACCHNARHA